MTQEQAKEQLATIVQAITFQTTCDLLADIATELSYAELDAGDEYLRDRWVDLADAMAGIAGEAEGL